MDTVQARFERDGYVFPLRAIAQTEAEILGERIRQLCEHELVATLGSHNQINNVHVISPAFNQLIRSPVLLDAVESLIGPDILVWGTSVFIKSAHSDSFVSWHQDLTYWGLSSDQEVSAWVALGPVTRANGAMRFLPGSHRLGQIAHRDSSDTSNILTRGQRADLDIDEGNAVHVELAPGEASLHHGHLLHDSGANYTDEPRLGLVINYIATSVSQSVSSRDFAMLVRGEDRYCHFETIPQPVAELDDKGLAWHHQIQQAQSEALYAGT